SMMGSCYQLKPDAQGKMSWSPYGYRDTTLDFTNAGPPVAGQQIVTATTGKASTDGAMEDVRLQSSPLRNGHGPANQAEGGEAGQVHAVQDVPNQGPAHDPAPGRPVHVPGRKRGGKRAGGNHRGMQSHDRGR